MFPGNGKQPWDRGGEEEINRLPRHNIAVEPNPNHAWTRDPSGYISAWLPLTGKAPEIMTGLLAVACVFVLPLAVAFADTLDIEGFKPFTSEGKPLKGLIITLDAGHGGYAHQPGYTGSARGVNSKSVENDLNMLVAAEVRHYLSEAGAEVHMTRWDDRKVAPITELERAQELGARTKVAVDSHSHLFIAMHHNASPRATADGVMLLIWPTDSAGKDQPLERELSSVLREEVEKWVHHKDKFDAMISEHPLVAGTDIPSACVEFGFLTNPEFDAWVVQQGAHRAEARGLYEGIVRMWREHGDELEAQRLRLFPDAKPMSMTTTPGDPQAADAAVADPSLSRPIAKIVRGLWPFDHAPKTEAEVNWVLSRYRASLADSTFFYFAVTAEQYKGKWVLRGATNYPTLASGARNLLAATGLKNVENRIETLPSARLGNLKFGVVQIPMALTWGKPAEGRDVKTQLLLGDRVFLLDQTPDAGYFLVQGADGYCGWVRCEAILRIDEAQFAEWSGAHTATITRDFMVDDFRLPAGASLPIIGESTAPGESMALRIPKGVRATKQADSVVVPAEYLSMRPSGKNSPGVLAAKAAAEYLTVPYIFGGRSRLGLDCSGLTGVAWASSGLALPRDAKQQIRVGRMVATPYYLPDLAPGDLVFFCDDAGTVIHTGVSLGGKRYIHASPPEVHIKSLDENDPLYGPYWRQRFAFARRPME